LKKKIELATQLVDNRFVERCRIGTIRWVAHVMGRKRTSNLMEVNIGKYEKENPM
jgi:hypothetical protein